MAVVVVRQMEAFSSRNTFNTPVHGVGFFSPALWTGIMLMSVVVVMLVFAIDMTYSIGTVDRFDNPKAKNLEIRPQ